MLANGSWTCPSCLELTEKAKKSPDCKMTSSKCGLAFKFSHFHSVKKKHICSRQYFSLTITFSCIRSHYPQASDFSKHQQYDLPVTKFLFFVPMGIIKRKSIYKYGARRSSTTVTRKWDLKHYSKSTGKTKDIADYFRFKRCTKAVMTIED